MDIEYIFSKHVDSLFNEIVIPSFLPTTWLPNAKEMDEIKERAKFLQFNSPTDIELIDDRLHFPIEIKTSRSRRDYIKVKATYVEDVGLHGNYVLRGLTDNKFPICIQRELNYHYGRLHGKQMSYRGRCRRHAEFEHGHMTGTLSITREVGKELVVFKVDVSDGAANGNFELTVVYTGRVVMDVVGKVKNSTIQSFTVLDDGQKRTYYSVESFRVNGGKFRMNDYKLENIVP